MLGAAINALAFSGTNYMFCHLDKKHADAERKRHDKAIEELQKAQAEWSKDRIKKLDFYNRYLQEQNSAENYIDNIDEAAHEYYLATGGQKGESSPSKPVLSDFYHPSDQQKNGEIALIIGVLGLSTYVIVKYI